MRIAILHLAGLEPTQDGGSSATPGFGAPLRPEDLERNLTFGRALARRGHDVHVLAADLVVPEALLPATVHTWRSFGAPGTLGAGAAPFNVHLAHDLTAGDGAQELLARFVDAVRPEAVLADLTPEHGARGRDAARRAGAASILRLPAHIGAFEFDDARMQVLRAADLVLAPSAEAALRARGALATASTSEHPAPLVETFAEGVDSRALQPEPRGALPGTPAPPLPHGMRCVLFDGDGDHDPLARALYHVSADVLQRRVDLGLVLPTHGTLASDVRGRGASTRSRVFTLAPAALDARDALARHARLIVFGDGPSAPAARRMARALARGVLPMARATGAAGELLALLAGHLPPELHTALALPGALEVDTTDLRERVTTILEHPEAPFLGPRLAALAAREFDWSGRAQAFERLVERKLAPPAASPLARSA